MNIVWVLVMRLHQKFKCQLCYRVKLKIVVSCVAVAGVLFILYQILLLGQQLENIRGTTKENIKYGDKNNYRDYSQTGTVQSDSKLPVRGIHSRDRNKYTPNSGGKFVCGISNNEIDFMKVNDDYCDCPEDGSDEPGTSACQKGRFVCLIQGSKVGFSDTVPSSRVNDGICDCCDGSDEWKTVTLTLRLKDSIQQKLGRYQQPCPNLCLV